MSINVIPSKESDEARNMHTKSNNIESMAGSETDKIIEELFKSLFQRYKGKLEESMKGMGLFLIVLFIALPSLKNKSEKNWIIMSRFSRMVKK